MKLFIIICLGLASTSYAGTHGVSSEETYFQWQSSASSLPGANPYKNKVTQRIQNSNVLRDMQQIREKLYKLADEKLEKCITPVGKQLDRHCVGRITGQIMQLISAVENSSRYGSYKSR